MLKNKHGFYQLIQKTRNMEVVSYALILVFILISTYCFSPKSNNNIKSNYRSSQLKTVTVKEKENERTSFVDPNGNIVIAADYGYATVMITRTDIGVLEKYYDDSGQPIRNSSGYYAVFREYDNGNNIRNNYLNPEGNLDMTLEGFAIEERKYNKHNQIIAVKYYDTKGNPVETLYYGYGKINEYDSKGRNIKTTYIDATDNPMLIYQGYASIIRQFYETDGPGKGKVENEFYYDEKGQPVALSLGQFGVHKEYNEIGQEATLTYLDAAGCPIITNKGYTKIVRTYQPNNQIETELYYDLEGKPFSLSEGQYGVKNESGKTLYLNQDGIVQFNTRTLLYNNTWLVFPFAFIIMIISVMLKPKMNVVLLAIYIVVIIYFTLMFRDDSTGKRTGILLFYRQMFINTEARADIIKNIWLFIPLGIILYNIYPKKIILIYPLILSLVIESIQYFFCVGFCELDDILSNTIGGYIGFLASQLTTNIKERIKSWKHIHIA